MSAAGDLYTCRIYGWGRNKSRTIIVTGQKLPASKRQAPSRQLVSDKKLEFFFNRPIRFDSIRFYSTGPERTPITKSLIFLVPGTHQRVHECGGDSPEEAEQQMFEPGRELVHDAEADDVLQQAAEEVVHRDRGRGDHADVHRRDGHRRQLQESGVRELVRGGADGPGYVGQGVELCQIQVSQMEGELLPHPQQILY